MTTETSSARTTSLNGPSAGGVPVLRDLVLLLARIGLGIIMIYHSTLFYTQWAGGSLSGVIDSFEQSGVPLAAVTAPANLFGEWIGGAALILGAAVRLVGVAMALNMLGAWVFVHTDGLMSAEGNGPELVIALGLLSLVLAATGSGRFGLDPMIWPRLRRRFGSTEGSASS